MCYREQSLATKIKFSYFLNGIDILANNLHCAFSIAGSNKNKLQKKDQIITNIGG